MQIIFLGTGAQIVTDKRRSPGILVEIDGDYVLLEAGPRTAQTLTEIGYSSTTIEYGR
jgi:ribonuclease BN (tRNA processing enzyme)